MLLITSQSKEIDQGNLVQRWPAFEWRIVFGSKYLWKRRSLLLDQRKYFWEWEKNISYGLKKIFKNEKKKCLNWKKKFREWGKEGVCVHLAFEKKFWEWEKWFLLDIEEKLLRKNDV